MSGDLIDQVDLLRRRLSEERWHLKRLEDQRKAQGARVDELTQQLLEKTTRLRHSVQPC